MSPADGSLNLAAVVPPADQDAGRHDRPFLIAFLVDRETESVLREGLTEATGETLDLRRGGIRMAIATMRKSATPRVLVVDLSGEEQPLTALNELSEAVEPDVRVLVVGEVGSADFYREVTRSLGASEYLSKPFTREKVLRLFGPFVHGSAFASPSMQGGRAIAITGVCGGVGATTVAVNVAWHLGVGLHRHTLLLDPDTHLGATGFLLNIQPGPGLRMALESPDRIDSLLAERATKPVADRLHVLAAEEKIASGTSYADGAAKALLTALRSRYNFIVADVPFRPVPLYRDLLDLVDQRILIVDPSLLSIRDTVRLLGLPKGAGQDQRALVVLNRVGVPGGLSRKQVEDALKMKVDVCIPYLPWKVGNAATLGDPVMITSPEFRNGVVNIVRQVASVSLLDGDNEGVVSGNVQGKHDLFSWFRRAAWSRSRSRPPVAASG
jgi:pilus assembly protein CpaE